MERSYQAQFFDYDKNNWTDVRLVIENGMLSFTHPIESESYGLKLNFKSKSYKEWLKIVKRPISLKIQFYSQSKNFIPLRNWLRAAFSKPFLCSTKQVIVSKIDKSFKIDIGFPFEEPIVFKIVSISEEEINRIFDNR